MGRVDELFHDFGITYSVETREARKVRITEAKQEFLELIIKSLPKEMEIKDEDYSEYMKGVVLSHNAIRKEVLATLSRLFENGGK